METILKPLRYDILASKYPISCKCEYHNTSEHTIDILARHIHGAESSRKKTIIIESKKTMPALGRVENVVTDLANKIDCLCRHFNNFEINEALVITDSNVSIRFKEKFGRASRKMASSRGMFISLISGSKFRTIDGMSRAIKNYPTDSSITIVHAGRNPDQDIGSPCPLNIDEIHKQYVCAFKPAEFNISVFKMKMSYNSADFLEDMAWAKQYRGVLNQIHACEGFTDAVPGDIKSSGLATGLIDHSLQKTLFLDYLDYHKESFE